MVINYYESSDFLGISFISIRLKQSNVSCIDATKNNYKKKNYICFLFIFQFFWFYFYFQIDFIFVIKSDFTKKCLDLRIFNIWKVDVNYNIILMCSNVPRLCLNSQSVTSPNIWFKNSYLLLLFNRIDQNTKIGCQQIKKCIEQTSWVINPQNYIYSYIIYII